MLYIIEICDEDGYFKRLVFDLESERDYNYDALKRDYGDCFCIRKRTYKEVEV